jgi:hypothetical protein
MTGNFCVSGQRIFDPAAHAITCFSARKNRENSRFFDIEKACFYPEFFLFMARFLTPKTVPKGPKPAKTGFLSDSPAGPDSALVCSFFRPGLLYKGVPRWCGPGRSLPG